MKKNSNKFIAVLGPNRNIIGVPDGVHINKGMSGGAGNFFTMSMSEKCDWLS